MIVTRFAPSPTGYLHLGHAYSALFAEHAAREAGGRFLLRIEDIDTTRCKPEFDNAIREDLAWLGLHWEEPVRRQSEHFTDYRAALDRLDATGLLYPCFCSRKDIAAEIARAGEAPHGLSPTHYPGTCRTLDDADRKRRIDAGDPYAIRLDAAKAFALTGPLTWTDRSAGIVTADPLCEGDVVLARRDTPTSYHLAVTVDDHLQGVTLVTRGIDLFPATHIHRLLQALLGYATPAYHHHPIRTNAAGERLSKRDGATAIRALRALGHAPEELRRMAGWR